MANFIEEFYYGNLDPQARSTKQNKTVQKQMEVLMLNEDFLTEHLSGENKKKFLDDNATYLGSQLECEFGGNRCFDIVANMDFLLVCTYEENGENPELVVYKKR